MRNAIRHPPAIATHATSGAATIAPSAAPLLKIPAARVRSCGGNHWVTIFTAAGQLPASPTPRRKRHTPNDQGPRATAWSMPATDHQMTNNA